MSYQKAIEIIKLAIAEVEWEYPMNYAVAFKKAIKALEYIDSHGINIEEEENEIPG